MFTIVKTEGRKEGRKSILHFLDIGIGRVSAEIFGGADFQVVSVIL